MQKNIKTHLILFIIGLFLSPSLFSQAFVDLSLSQILTPDSILFCTNQDVRVKVLVSMPEGNALDSFQLSYQLDNRVVIVEKVKRRIMRNDTVQYEFMTPISKDSILNGKGTLKVTVNTINPDRDYYFPNNSMSITFRSSAPKNSPYSMDFEGTTRPPIDWVGIKTEYYDQGIGGYIKNYVRGSNNEITNSLVFHNYNSYPASSIVVKSPLFDLGNADLPYLYFNHSYGNGGLDTFSVEVTKDCGNTYQTLFRKGGSQLWTMETFRRDPYDMSNWSRDSFNIQAFLGQKVQFRFTHKSITNDIFYFDDFKVANRNVLNKDLILVRRVSPDDNPICPSDRNKIPVEVVLRNIGKIATDTIQLAFRVNNNNWVRETLVKKLNLDDTLHYTFTQLMQVPDTGAAILTIAVGQNNEQNTLNDTLKTTFNPRREYSVPFIERFETTAALPPKDWPTGDFYHSFYVLYKQTDVIGRNGQASSVIYFDDRGGTLPMYITSAAINLKGVRDPYLAFDVAYRPYDQQGSLTVQVSTDCGLTFQSIYYKSEDSLKTNDNIPYSGPTAANHWRRDSVSLLSYKDKDVMFRFVGLNSSSGRSIYLDNIEVFNRSTPAKDAAITNIQYPVLGIFCPVGKTDLPLQIVVSNTGLSKLDTFIISYKINNTPSVFDTVVRSLAFGESFIHQFKKLPPFPKGGNLTFFYTVKTNGDLDNRNDTLSNQVLFPTQNALPFVENFETDDAINYYTLPKEWSSSSYNTWSRARVINSNGLKGSSMRHPFGSNSPNEWLKTPFIDLKKTGSPYLTFDLAYARIDTYKVNTLKIEISTDCGNTFKPTAYNKTGKALETYTTTSYNPEPLLATDWRRDTVDLSSFKDSLVILRFVGNSSDGTPLFMDNVKVEAGFTKDVSLLSRIFPDTTPVCYPLRGVVPVRLAIRNDGVARVDTIKLSYRLNTEGVVSQTFIKRLNFKDTAVFTFSQLMKVPTAGNHILTFTLNVNGDENSINDTLITTFRLRPQYAANITEGLESSDFPPLDWTLKKADPYTSKWEIVRVIGSNGDSTTASCLSTLYSSTPREPDAIDALTTYPVDLRNLSNPIALFDLSYMGYTGIIGGGTDTANTFKVYYNDTLRVEISTDCGQTFRPTGYKKTNIALTTALRTYASFPDYGPRITAASDWRKDTIDLSAYKGGVVQLRFIHTPPATATNTLYLDNFQFVNHESKNLSLYNWVTPNDSTILCHEEAFPIEVKLRNEGRTMIDSFEIKYQIDNQTEVKAIAQLSIRPNDSKNYRFDNLLRGVKSGEHTLRVIIRVAGDSVSVGDTLFRKINVGSLNTLPVIETFEDAFMHFPPKDWQVQERNYFFTTNWRWGFGKDRFDNDTYTATYFSNQNGLTAQDALTSWQVNLRGMKNPYLIFDIAAFRYYLQDGDSFFIEYSTDCGATYQRTDYKKGTSQVVTDANPTFGSAKSPNRNQWRSDSVRLINLKDSLVQFRFSILKNLGIVIHLDNVRVVELPITKTSEINDTPQYSRVFPNPTTGDLTIELIRNFAQPIDCQLINAQGQVVKRQKITDANQHHWQIQDVPAGMYFLFIGINNQFDKHKIILIK